MKISAKKGERKTKLLILSVESAIFKAFNQKTNGSPNSNIPIYAELYKPLMFSNLKSDKTTSAIIIYIRPKTKFRNNLTTSSLLSLTLKIQKKAQNTELIKAKKTPNGSLTSNESKLPLNEMKNTPKKLIIIATKLLKVSFWPRKGIESKTSIIGHV